jgi:hypothetical protein
MTECTKVKHRTKVGAIIAWKRTGRNPQMNVYCCPICKSWHMGTSGKGVRKMQRISQLLDRVLPT